MTKELYLLRHAKSDWSTPCSDFDRPLNTRGKHQSIQIGQWMQARQIIPQCLVSSPAVRARETTLNICDMIHFNVMDVSWQDELYHANHHVMLEAVKKFLSQYDKILMIAHNPGMEDFLKFLCPDKELAYTKTGKLMTTASLACICLPNDPASIQLHTGYIETLIRPGDLD
jgi:phosphohistidine phosphatase